MDGEFFATANNEGKFGYVSCTEEEVKTGDVVCNEITYVDDSTYVLDVDDTDIIVGTSEVNTTDQASVKVNDEDIVVAYLNRDTDGSTYDINVKIAENEEGKMELNVNVSDQNSDFAVDSSYTLEQ